MRLGGLPGSSAGVVAAALARSMPERPVVIVAPGPAEAERWLADLRHLTDLPLAYYPQRESLGEDEAHLEIAGERVETLDDLLSGRLRLLVTTARATAERTSVPLALGEARLVLHAPEDGKAMAAGPSLSEVSDQLEEMGYLRVPQVTQVAEFSVRGGIVDVYGFGMAQPRVTTEGEASFTRSLAKSKPRARNARSDRDRAARLPTHGLDPNRDTRARGCCGSRRDHRLLRRALPRERVHARGPRGFARRSRQAEKAPDST